MARFVYTGKCACVCVCGCACICFGLFSHFQQTAGKIIVSNHKTADRAVLTKKTERTNERTNTGTNETNLSMHRHT